MSRRETARDTGIVGTPLGQHIFSCNYQCRLRRLQVGIGFERALNQIVERLRMEQGPPLAWDVVPFNQVLRFSTGDVTRAARGRNWSGSITGNIWSNRLLISRPARPSCREQQGRSREEAGEARFVFANHKNDFLKACGAYEFR